MIREPLCSRHQESLQFRVIIPIAISLFMLALPAFATQYWAPEKIRAMESVQHPTFDSQNPTGQPPNQPPQIYPYNYYARYMLCANWLHPLQVTTNDVNYGGQREGEGGYYDIIQTDNTQEAIVIWSNARLLSGNDTLFQTELPRSWIYLRQFPAWLEEGSNGDYYRSHNSCWGIAATMAYITASHDSSVIGYGDSCANYIRDYPCVGSYSFDAEGMATGALALYARWRGGSNSARWLDTALARGQRLRLTIQTNPSYYLGNSGAGWALSGGCAFWGVVNSICREDTTFGIPWINQYAPSIGVRGGTASWANAWSTWYGNAWTNAYELTHNEAFRDTSVVIANYLLAQDADNDGGIPATVGEASNQEQSWVSMYLDWMLLYPLTNWLQPYPNDLSVTASITPNRFVVMGDSVTLHLTVTNLGRQPLSYGIHSEATGTTLPLDSTFNDSTLDLGSLRNYSYSLGVANTDTIRAFVRFLTHDSLPGDDSAVVVVAVRSTITVTGVISVSDSQGVTAQVTFRSLEDTTRTAQTNTNVRGEYNIDLPAGSWAVSVNPTIPYARPNPDTIQISVSGNHFDKRVVSAYLWVVEDDSTTSFASYIEPSVAASGVSYRLDKLETITDLRTDLTLFPAVLWFTGNRVVPFDTSEFSAIHAALAHGTHFIMTGQNIAQRMNSLDVALLHRFGASFQAPQISNYHIIGITSTPWSGVDTHIVGAGGANNQTMQDAIGVYTGGTVWANYSGLSGTYCVVGTSMPDSAKTVLITFGLEAVNGNGTSSRDGLIQTIITWLQTSGVADGVQKATLPDHLVLSTYPNPFNNELNVNIALPKAGEVTIVVYNAIGEKVETAKMFSNGHVQWQWNASRMSSGIYWIEAKSRDNRALKKVAYIR